MLVSTELQRALVPCLQLNASKLETDVVRMSHE